MSERKVLLREADENAWFAFFSPLESEDDVAVGATAVDAFASLVRLHPELGFSLEVGA